MDRIDELSRMLGRPVQALYERKVDGDKVNENWHVYVAGLQIMADAPTLPDAIEDIKLQVGPTRTVGHLEP